MSIGRRGVRGDKGSRGDRGIRGDRGTDADTEEIIDYLNRIEEKTDKHTELLGVHSIDLAVIKTQVIATNGTVKKNCSDIDSLYKLNNDDEKRWASFTGSLNTWKILPMILGAIATMLGIYAFFIKP